ncbi:MAG: hypothetical protein ACK5LC_17025, partial [Coprobacillaceae bacterium]
FIKNDSGGGCRLEGITVITIKDNTGTDTSKDKVDGSMSGQELLFSSTYKKIAGSDINTPDADGYISLKVSNTIAGDLADLTKIFTYRITLQASPILTTAEQTASSYVYYIVDKDGVEVAGTRDTVNITGSTVLTIPLAHDQSIVFKNLPTGTKYYGIEDKITDYTSVAAITKDGLTVNNIEYKEASGNLIINLNNAESCDVMLTENENLAAVVNTYKDVSITGVLIENLPFVILIILGIGGLGFYAVSKRRKTTR